MTIYTGSGVAIITPFLEDGMVDYKELEKLIEFQIKEGTKALIIVGTTGESSTMLDDEQIEVIEFAVKKVNKRIPVIAGTGVNDARHAVYLSTEAERVGADALLVVTPYYNKTTQKGLIEHFEYIADRVNIPIVLYGVPGRTGQVMTPETIAHLSNHKNIVAYKDATGEMSHTLEVIRLCGDSIDIYCGNDDINVPMIAAGAKGSISVLANVYPKINQEMCKLALEGKISEAMKIQLKYNKFTNLLFAEPNPMPVKKCLEHLGFSKAYYRLPMTQINDSLSRKLKKEMDNLN
ncbi:MULTISPECIES: 4-hydroxy-tetrahydrodipicolinate synthase [unclassified Gemella]|uniref:4-hydroxy-tetrahydrodipicolinate synthase n=1 Tax=unclassified Gemella TaxID=2624949 RepID=UPI0010749DE2|nr:MULTISPECIES: 4-hydroxy-tetrahydrodipicolinate synthase [unclassified Gemella]MBF0710022.1 4-hydroxy-tetrahydrodipicolinate synthase [Gemella sp. GL1.1]MBF0746101.1 4-hydroxy-tetrahydrodipicolinate synthase [Gemella sp. 19428wG2_WT2a]NYS27366.1 4-hydroxy-tetrahydrodipicolinate synthase [Gemella sp. GL1]TFU60391.1 4-hydroxy-tetrahydrodipicolinate synthase [Gemella sp. WT2a]